MRVAAIVFGVAVILVLGVSPLSAGGTLSFGTPVAKMSQVSPVSSIPLDLTFDHAQGLAALQFRVAAPAREITLGGVVRGAVLSGPPDWGCAWNVVPGGSCDTLIVVVWSRNLVGLQPGSYPGFLSVTFSRNQGGDFTARTPRMTLTGIVSALSGGQGEAGTITVGDTPTAMVVVEAPAEFRLDQNYPNPFNPTTVIRFAVPVEGRVRITVFNMIGQEIASAFDGTVRPGEQSVRFDASRLPAGVYMYRLTLGNMAATRSMVLVK